jgi:hypothetical protein
MAKKMLPPNISIWWVPDPAGIADVNAPTAAEINAGINISCALTAELTLGWTDRDTDDTAGLCDDANVQNPLRKNYEGQLTFFLDADKDDVASVYNEAKEIFREPLQLGYLVQRIGKHPRNFPSAADGDEITTFKFLSGDPNILNDPSAPVQMQVTFYAQGVSSDGIIRVGGTPSTPVTTAATSVTSTGFTANWTWSAGTGPATTGYIVQYKLTSASTWTTVSPDTAAGTLTKAITGLTTASSYQFRVIAKSASGNSEVSNVTSVTTS